MTANKRDYNAENKSRIRQIIIDEIRKRDINSIVTLESPEFLFSKLLPDKKILIFENEAKICTKLEKKAPKNIEVVFGNINKLGIFNGSWDMIYLDFCRTWEKEQENIVKLINELKKTKLFALTICMRCNEKLSDRFQGDYQFDILKKIQELTKINWKVVYGESYTDSVQMMTLILENKE